MDAAEAMAHYLAEWYLPELTEQSVDDLVARLDAAATAVTDEGTQSGYSSRSRYPRMKCCMAPSAPTLQTSLRGRAFRPASRTTGCPPKSERGYGRHLPPRTPKQQHPDSPPAARPHNA
jgi:hypothetical protein